MAAGGTAPSDQIGYSRVLVTVAESHCVIGA
jgi:hypothetical protein